MAKQDGKKEEKTRYVHIDIVKYQKEENGPWRLAVRINEGEGPVVDCETNEIPKKIWQYHPCPYILSIGMILPEKA